MVKRDVKIQNQRLPDTVRNCDSCIWNAAIHASKKKLLADPNEHSTVRMDLP